MRNDSNSNFFIELYKIIEKESLWSAFAVKEKDLSTLTEKWKPGSSYFSLIYEHRGIILSDPVFINTNYHLDSPISVMFYAWDYAENCILFVGESLETPPCHSIKIRKKTMNLFQPQMGMYFVTSDGWSRSYGQNVFIVYVGSDLPRHYFLDPVGTIIWTYINPFVSSRFFKDV